MVGGCGDYNVFMLCRRSGATCSFVTAMARATALICPSLCLGKKVPWVGWLEKVWGLKKPLIYLRWGRGFMGLAVSELYKDLRIVS